MRSGLHSRFAVAGVVFACVAGLTFITKSQTQRPAVQQSSDKVVVDTGEVLLDAVVRDKKGRLLKDLTASDFEVYEDGVRQEINSFRIASSTSGEGEANPAKRGAQQGRRGDQQNQIAGSERPISTGNTSSLTGVTAVALVFDRLSPDARTTAYKAALSYLDESANTRELFGVFLTDLSVVVLQSFTDDRSLVKAGIEKAGEHNSSLYTSNNAKAREVRDKVSHSMASAGQVRSASADLDAVRMELFALERWEELQRDELGNASARGLLLIASALRPLPGRKAVIFFSEGLILPPSVMYTFQAVINAANRNNVAFYAVDAAGLRVESKTAETNREIRSRSDLRMTELGSNTEHVGPMTKGLERNEDLLRLNPDSGLGRLANETGGFLITDSNDLKGRLRQVDEDLHAYYLLSYRSSNQNYDGHFRKVEVKLKRSGLNVQSRKGYFAINGTFASPVLSYEAPALAVLANTPKVNSFPFYAGGFSFPEKERMSFAPVLVDVPLSAFTFDVDQEKKSYDTDFSIVALIKDQAGQVVRKLSNQYRLNGPIDKLEQGKQERVLFYREADLAPGRYTLETIAYDAPSGRASVRSGTIEVAAGDEGKLRMSDVVILKRAEPASAVDEKRSNPFLVSKVMVSPNLGAPIQRSLKQVPFFFTVYTPAGASTGPKLTVELRQQGRTLAQMPGELMQPDATGRIQYLAGLPLEKIPAGAYELRITISDGATTVARSGSFMIED